MDLISYSFCVLPAVNMVVSNLQPEPVPIYPGSDKMLFKPVYHIWADYNNTRDGGTWPSGDVRMDFNFWHIVEKPGFSFTYTPEDPVAEGWYNVQVGECQGEIGGRVERRRAYGRGRHGLRREIGPGRG
jgi:hypothetical protein